MDRSTKVPLRTGRAMPLIGLGTWKLDKDTAEKIELAIEEGYTMIDTSGDYDTQPGIAEGLRHAGVTRGDIFIVTKVEETEDALESAKRNVGQLDIGHADLILIHRPPQYGAGEPLWEGLQRARDEGITRDIGVSNYSVEQLEALMETSGEVPVVNQIEWSPFGFSDEMLEFCKRHGIVVQAYSPLTRGEQLGDARLATLARAYGKSPAQMILRWNLQRGTIPLPKAARRVHRRENLAVFDFEISQRDMDVIDGFNRHYSALGELQYV
ncbi:aldo/keto reductase family protein [Pelagibacterium limicola]|uniref:aldo/keto reductase family protein n=1 Tax=Pelagibacterium limicola TaxID=2791022 RepID=UPI0018AF8869|nr:aldo/keto reductase [Pelagibacterium limicola]